MEDGKRRASVGEQEERKRKEPPLYLMTLWRAFYLLFALFAPLRHVLQFFRVLPFSERGLLRTDVRADCAPLYDRSVAFYHEHAYRRIDDLFNRHVVSAPGASIDVVVDAKRRLVLRCINMASYNYLGLAHAGAPKKVVEAGGVGSCRAEADVGTTTRRLERLVARFVGTEDACVFPMGFCTNSSNVDALVATCDNAARKTLLLSDSSNHASLAMGCRLARSSTVKRFRHNDLCDLERQLRAAICTKPQPSKIVVLVEGVYSMEGSTCPLGKLMALKARYRFYLFVDEAHSIGAVGASGRGVCELFGVDPALVDVLMGTFTKSFNAQGGYLAGRRDVIAHVRRNSGAYQYGQAFAPPVVEQIEDALKMLCDDVDGEAAQRLAALHDNTAFFRDGLERLGCVIDGEVCTPIVPWILYTPWAMAAASRELLRRGVAVVGVSFPATPLLGSRIRFCLSAAHTRTTLQEVLEKIAEVVQLLGPTYCVRV